MPEAENVTQALALLREAATQASQSWRGRVEGAGDPDLAKVILHVPTGAATPAALALYAVDREMRRAAQILRSGFQTEHAQRSIARTFRPTPVERGGLTIQTTEPGSLDFLLAAFGAVAHVLLSDPVQVAVTTKELLGWAGRLVITVTRPFRRNPVTVYESTGRLGVKADSQGIEFDSVPQGTRVVIEHRLRDGTATRIEIER
jgi:hypothetical protein